MSTLHYTLRNVNNTAFREEEEFLLHLGMRKDSCTTQRQSSEELMGK